MRVLVALTLKEQQSSPSICQGSDRTNSNAPYGLILLKLAKLWFGG
jgi:hypothetical protein